MNVTSAATNLWSPVRAETITLIGALRYVKDSHVLSIWGSPDEIVCMAKSGLTVTAEDKNPGVLEQIQRHADANGVAKNVIVRVHDIRSGMTQWAFDGVHCSNVLQLLENMRTVTWVITRLQDITKPWWLHSFRYHSRFPGFHGEIPLTEMKRMYRPWTHFISTDLWPCKPGGHSSYFPLMKFFARK